MQAMTARIVVVVGAAQVDFGVVVLRLSFAPRLNSPNGHRTVANYA